MRILVPALLAALTLTAAPASAGPTFLRGGSTSPNYFGATGLLTIPSAETVGDRGISGHAYFTDDFNSFGALVGPVDRFELGVTFVDRDGGDDGLLLNGKFAVLREGAVFPGLSVGVIDAFDDLDVDPSWYVVASKRLPNFLPVLGGFGVHLGYGGGLYDNEVFAGVEWRIGTPLDVIPVSRPTFSAIAEYAAGDVNLGLRGRWRGLAVTVSLFDFDNFGAGVSYTTGLRVW